MAITLFRVWGFRIRLDVSWLVIAFLVITSLGRNFFPSIIPGESAATYWTMSAAALLGMVISILLHELGHAVVARRHGLKIDSITLFIFGGVAELRDEPRNARSEFLIAIAGPAVSAVLAAMAWAGKEAATTLGTPSTAAIIWYLWIVNTILLVFNLAPAYPLDGGRVLRAGLWAWKKDLVGATRIASALGAGFGVLLMGLGVLTIISGAAMGGLWYIIIGWFIRSASKASYQQVLFQAKLKGKPVALFMKAAPPSAPADAKLGEVLRGHLRYGAWTAVTVLGDAGSRGVLTRRMASEAMEKFGADISIGEVADFSGQEQRIGQQADAAEALSKMVHAGKQRLFVTGPEGQVEGVLHLRDLIRAPKADLQP